VSLEFNQSWTRMYIECYCNDSKRMRKKVKAMRCTRHPDHRSCSLLVQHHNVNRFWLLLNMANYMPDESRNFVQFKRKEVKHVVSLSSKETELYSYKNTNTTAAVAFSGTGLYWTTTALRIVLTTSSLS